MKHFRVKIGFGKDEFISIDETELRKALIGQIRGRDAVVIFKEGSVTGNSILSVTPDFNRDLGYARDYVLNGEDYAQIGGNTVEDYRVLMVSAKSEAFEQLEGAEGSKLLLS